MKKKAPPKKKRSVKIPTSGMTAHLDQEILIVTQDGSIKISPDGKASLKGYKGKMWSRFVSLTSLAAFANLEM